MEEGVEVANNLHCGECYVCGVLEKKSSLKNQHFCLRVAVVALGKYMARA